MKIAWFDCFSGAAGDMIVGACLDAGASWESFRREISKLNLDDEATLAAEKVTKKGIAATAFTVRLKNHADHGHHHSHHRHLPDILDIINGSSLNQKVKKNAVAIFEKLARAEASVHGCPIEQVHFHEVGAVDAIIDIVGACTALELLEVEKVCCSALTVGGGTVRIEHGLLPVPAPATAELMKGLPASSGGIEMELLTPTGAAILTTLSDNFGPMPPMRLENVGYGAGQKDCPDRPNVLRMLLGESDDSSDTGGILSDEVLVLETNLDDCTGEIIGYTFGKLLAAGALDVFCTPIQMKKNRPASLVSVICRPDQRSMFEKILFEETMTFGIRRRLCQRSILTRKFATVETAYGPIRIKTTDPASHSAAGSVEYEDCQRAAAAHHVPLKTVIDAAMFAWQNDRVSHPER
jgi:pyridinium-3,5-bisthiocarboxylic acid mononucleotide nickel chelatase